jgi:hypothetical protein
VEITRGPGCRRIVLPAALVAGTVSGLPSTLHAIATGRPVLGSTRAAGALLGRPGLRRGVLAHTTVTLGWTSVFVVALPRRHTVAWGAVGGLAIAALDLTIADRLFPPIAALPRSAQVADHILFGAVVGAVVGQRRRTR